MQQAEQEERGQLQQAEREGGSCSRQGPSSAKALQTVLWRPLAGLGEEELVREAEAGREEKMRE